MGLVPSPKVVSPLEWEDIKAKGLARKNDFCPICQDRYRLQDQVLLSCSHLFHRQCIGSYERFTGSRCCPVCRTTEYRKLLTCQKTKELNRCATVIQSCWRGFKQRILFLKSTEKHIPKHPLLKTKFCITKVL